MPSTASSNSTSSTKARRRAAAIAVGTVGALLALPMVPASAGTVSYAGVQVALPKVVTIEPTVDPGPVVATVSATAAAVEEQYIGQFNGSIPTSFETPTGVYAGDDPTTIQAWDFVEPPVDVTPEQTAVSLTDAQLSAVDGDGGGCLGWYYDIDKSKSYKRTIRNRGTTYSLNNQTDSAGEISVTHAQEMGGSVTISVSGEVEAGVIISKVKATFGLSVTASVKWTTEIGYKITAAPHRLTHLSGAIYGWSTSGHYYHKNTKCVVDDDKGTVTAFTPQTNQHLYNAWSEPAIG